MLEATRFDGSGLQNLGSGLPRESGGIVNDIIQDRRQGINSLILDQRRERDIEVRTRMNQEQLYMLRVGMQVVLITMMNSLDLIITPVTNIQWSHEDHAKLIKDIKSWQQIYKNYLQELISKKEIGEYREFETWAMQNPADYESWMINQRCKDILGERSANYIEQYGLSFEKEWNAGSREINSLLSRLTPLGSNNNDPCAISKIAIAQLEPKYPH